MPKPTLSVHAAFCVALSLFVIFKLPHLAYPFYWDESWVYAPAIYTLHEHGASILPNAIPPELSRGHPLLFHAVYVLWMNITGATNFSMHVLSLIFSVSLVLSVYRILFTRFDEETALYGALILMATHEFFMASAFVLNDIALGWLSLLAIHFYLNGSNKRAALFFTLLVLVKESGIVIWVAICGHALWQFRVRRDSRRKWPVLIIPAAALFAFLAVQKWQMGWFFYPGHVSLIETGLQSALSKLQLSLQFLLVDSGQWLAGLLLAVLLLACFIRTRGKRYLGAVLYLAVLLIHIVVFSSKDAVFYVFIAASLVLFVRFTPRIKLSFSPAQLHFFRVAFICVLTFVYFCCINFFETRYLFPALLFLQVVIAPPIAAGLMKQAGLTAPFRYLLVVTIVLLMTTYNHRLVEFDRMWVQSDVVRFMETRQLYNEHICTPSFFEKLHLTNPKTGFRNTRQIFSNISEQLSEHTSYIIVDNIETSHINYPAGFKDNNFRIIYQSKKGDVNAFVYRRR